ncbi:MAG: phosphatidate cytidylyltransferase [Oscillospiraceae bacterium]|nr:phosphatidate cytidylyltransferase [Oscillospiraceae bacterium]
MKERILVAAIGLPLLVVMLLWLPVPVTAGVLSLLSAIAVHELLYVTGLLRSVRITAVSMAMAVFVCVWSYFGMLALPMQIAAVVFVVYLFAELLAANTRLDFANLCLALFAAVVLPYCLSAVTRILCMESGRALALLPFVMTMVPDSGAFFVGCACGKHKLAPQISPHKTVEGVVGGIVTGILGMLLYALILQSCGFRVNYLYAAVYGLLGAGGSTLGDLAFSTVKRQHGIKDFGNLLPGHGGVLDRFDSTMVVAPLAELLLILIPFAVML